MGRKKKEEICASAEGIQFVKALIKNYETLKVNCLKVEEKRPSLLKYTAVDPADFTKEAYPSEAFCVEPKIGFTDQEVVEGYLDAKEKVYLLEHSVWGLEGQTHDVAEALFLLGQSWEEVISTQCLSRMTVCRERKKAILLIAREVDAFMEWKAKELYF